MTTVTTIVWGGGNLDATRASGTSCDADYGRRSRPYVGACGRSVLGARPGAGLFDVWRIGHPAGFVSAWRGCLTWQPCTPSAPVIVSIDPNQAAPDYEMGSTEPSISSVRLVLTQPVGANLSDLELLIARRDDLLDVLGPLTGVLRGASPPVPEPHVFKGRPWGKAWSKSWGPNFE